MGSGCMSNICNNEVRFDEVNMKISKKNVQTLEKYGKGAVARREANRLKIEQIREVAGKYNPPAHLNFLIDL